MKRSQISLKKPVAALQLFFMMVWASYLSKTDSLYSAYALCCILAVLCLCDNYSKDRHMRGIPLALNLTLASLLSLACALANYPIFQYYRTDCAPSTNLILNLIGAAATFVGGIVIFYQIFLLAVHCFPKVCKEENLPTGQHPGRIFAASFCVFSAIYLVYLLFVAYPGSVTSDAMWQVSQTYTGDYSVHHPYWHTILIKLFMSLGYALFKDPNAAAATYNGVQALCSAATFAYAVTTLYQHRIPKGIIAVVFAMFALLPHHITYSATMWKDVPFGLTMLVLVVAMFRIIRNVGKNRWLNYVVFMIGGIGTAVFRNNGWYALLASFVILLLFFRKRCRELLLPWLLVLVIGWVMNGPAMTWLNVSRNNFMESLAVPTQQIARVIVEGCELTEEETQMLSMIMDLEEIPELYWAQCVDPVKDEIKAKNLDYLIENKADYFKLWIQLGLKYPWVYVEAWVEETKGYWNGGYDYYIYAQYVQENDYGMYMVEQDNLIHDLMKAYFTITRETIFFQPFQSIGLNIWLLSLLCFLNMVWGRKEFLLTMPVIGVVFTLWLTTPVFSEFRYAYCIFTTLPFILPISLCRSPGEDECEDGKEQHKAIKGGKMNVGGHDHIAVPVCDARTDCR